MALGSNNDAESQSLEVDLTQYVRLRTILDSLELGAIIRFMQLGADQPEGFGELETRLVAITDWLWKKDTVVANGTIECPPGYIDCRGVCVPYPCPNRFV